MILPLIIWAQNTPISSFPYNCNFENPAENAQWYMANASETNHWIIGDATHNEGSKSLYISNNEADYYYSTNSPSHVFVYRAIILTPGLYTYDFDWQGYGEDCCDYLRVAIVPDTTTLVGGQAGEWGTTTMPAGSIALDGGSKLNLQNSWAHRSGQFEWDSTGNYFLVFYWNNDIAAGRQSPAAIDNIVIARYTCPTPTTPTVSNISTNSATLHWTINPQSSIEIEYGSRGFTHGNGQRIIIASGDSATLTGLTHSYPYEAYIRSICEVGDTGMWTPSVTFTTLCAPIDALPYEETFDSWGTGTNARPSCWNMGGYSYYPHIINSDNGGALNLYVYNSTSVGENTVFATLPIIGNNIQLTHTQLIVRLKGSGSNEYSSDLIIGVCNLPEDLNSFVGIDTILNLTSTFNSFEIPLEHYTGTGRYITLLSKQLTSGHDYYSNQVFLDDIILEELPNCRRPQRLNATNATTSSAILDWNEMGQAQQWELTYGPAGYEQGTRIIVNNKPYTLTGLTEGTSYEFNVRSICSASDTGSLAISRGAFTTTQLTTSIPYSYGFEEASEWNGWQSNSDNDIAWIRGNATFSEGSHAAYISPDGNSVGNNNFSSRVNASLYRDINFGETDSSFTLSFIARAGGTEDFLFDGLMVLVEDPTHAVVTPTMDTTSPWGSISTLHSLATVRCDTLWKRYTTSIDHISGVKRLVFYWFNMNTGLYYSHINFPAAVDNIEIDFSTCPRPTALTSTPVNEQSVRIAWQGPANGNYKIFYKKHSDNNYQSIQSNSNPTLLQGLETGMQYECFVQKYCGNDSSLSSEVLHFTTPCREHVTLFPFIENFEGGTLCWQQEFLQGTIDWSLHNGDGSTAHPIPAYQGNANALLFFSNPAEQSTRLISPVFDFTHYQNVVLTFAHLHRSRSNRIDSLIVLYRNDEENDWEVLSTYANAVTNWRLDTLILPNTSRHYQIAFEGHTKAGFGIGIDMVKITADTNITPIIECNTPTQLNAVNYDRGESVVLDWECDDTQNLWEIKQHSSEDNPMNQYFVITNHPTTISQLLLGNHSYTFSVRAICDEDIYSDWSNSITIITSPITDILSVNKNNLFKLFPNPSTGDVTLQLDNSTQKCNLQITDLVGRIVEARNIENPDTPVQLHLTHGYYLVKVWNHENSSVQRLIIR